MLTSILENYKGDVLVNGTLISSPSNFDFNMFEGSISILLRPHKDNGSSAKFEGSSPIEEDNDTWCVQVKKWMTQPSTPSFDFQTRWNKGVPMPYMIMYGEEVPEKETRGMVYMRLHADIKDECPSVCMCCGRKLTHPVSKYFGVGPECGGHMYDNPFPSDAALKAAVKARKEELRRVTWEGYIAKSAIVSKTHV